MGRKISQEALRKHKEESLKTLETYIDSLINDENPKIQSKADKLSFWLEHWTTFLSFESKFRSTSLRRYKRGEIIKVHLGYMESLLSTLRDYKPKRLVCVFGCGGNRSKDRR